mmetsp:Transcript_119036/g.379628  ORF Transcript_119036/g.379628 Transcript_119036/m.379628 type:complete len:546 (+) Transcript_119036:3020-4657(+)
MPARGRVQVLRGKDRQVCDRRRGHVRIVEQLAPGQQQGPAVGVFTTEGRQHRAVGALDGTRRGIAALGEGAGHDRLHRAEGERLLGLLVASPERALVVHAEEQEGHHFGRDLRAGMRIDGHREAGGLEVALLPEVLEDAVAELERCLGAVETRGVGRACARVGRAPGLGGRVVRCHRPGVEAASDVLRATGCCRCLGGEGDPQVGQPANGHGDTTPGPALPGIEALTDHVDVPLLRLVLPCRGARPLRPGRAGRGRRSLGDGALGLELPVPLRVHVEVLGQKVVLVRQTDLLTILLRSDQHIYVHQGWAEEVPIPQAQGQGSLQLLELALHARPSTLHLVPEALSREHQMRRKRQHMLQRVVRRVAPEAHVVELRAIGPLGLHWRRGPHGLLRARAALFLGLKLQPALRERLQSLDRALCPLVVRLEPHENCLQEFALLGSDLAQAHLRDLWSRQFALPGRWRLRDRLRLASRKVLRSCPPELGRQAVLEFEGLEKAGQDPLGLRPKVLGLCDHLLYAHDSLRFGVTDDFFCPVVILDLHDSKAG